MSATFITEFFPDGAAFLQVRHPWLWAAVFPPALQASCSSKEVIAEVMQFSIKLRWPLLMPLALVGVFLGAAGFAHFARAQRCFLSYAMLYYSAMNVAALLSHCLSEPGTRLKQFWISLDVSFTGASAVCLALATFDSVEYAPVSQRFKAKWARMLFVLLLFIVLRLPSQFVNEWVYLGTIFVAALCVLGNNLSRKPTGSRQGWMLLAAFSALAAITGLVGDKYLCRSFGSWLNYVHVLFLSCNFAFYSIWQMYQQGSRQHDKCINGKKAL